MKTRDLSPGLIGRTVRVERPGIAGTHNYIEGVLEDFDFDTKDIYTTNRPDSLKVTADNLTAVIAGLIFDLNGTEPLTVTEGAARD